MGSPAPSLQLESAVVAPNAAIVLEGNFDLTSRSFAVRDGRALIELAEPEVWAPFGTINPGGHRWLLLRPARGEWPTGARLTIDVSGSPEYRFSAKTGVERAIVPPTLGAFEQPYEQTFDLPIYGRQHQLFIPYGAMKSPSSTVLRLELTFERDRSEHTTTAIGAIEANAPGIVSMQPFGGGLLPCIVEARLIDTAGNHTVHVPSRSGT
ncbi:MAG: hypothetical protein ACXVEE_28645 [Polyangiales bacterium]